MNEEGNLNTSEYWDNHYKEGFYQDATAGDRALTKMFIDKVLKGIEPKGTNIVDLACGLGDYVDYCERKGFAAFGVDFSSIAINECKQRFAGRFIQSDIEDFLEGVQPGSIKIIFMFEILEHYFNPQRILQKVYNALAEDGMVVFSVPQELARHADAEYHHSKWNYQFATDTFLQRFSSVEFFKFSGDTISLKGVAYK